MTSSNNVTLIGMPGAGKSTLGVVVAKILRKDFLDCDLLIQRETEQTLQQLIDEQGAEGFLTLENNVISSISVKNSIISTGGSAVYSAEAMEHLAQLGPVVYLRISYETLLTRLGDLSERGVVMKAGVSLDLHELYDERIPLYESYADVCVDVDGLTISEAAQTVVQALGELR